MNTKYIALLMYDIPNNNLKEQKKYLKFRNKILAEGFLMIQESVYVKSLKRKDNYQRVKVNLNNLAPKESDIRLLRLTESQFNMMDIVNGKLSFNEKVISSKERIIRC